MLIYGILFFTLIVLWFADFGSKGNRIKVVATFIVFSVIGLRDITVGADTQVYQDLYQRNYDWGSNEIGYTWLTKTCNNAGVSFNLFLILVAAVCAICFYQCVRRYSTDYVYSLILFVGLGNFTMFMTGLRQTIAISIVSLAIIAMIKKKWYYFFPLVIIASLFHYSALFILPTYFLRYVKFSRKNTMVLAVTIWSVLLVFGNNVFQIISKYLPMQYAEDLIYNAGKYSVNILVIAIELSIFIFCWFCMPRNIDNDDDNIWGLFVFFQLIIVGLQLGANQSMQILRIAYYLDIAKLVLVPRVISRFKEKDRFILQLTIIVLTIAKFFITVPGGYSKIDEYIFFFMS